MSAMRYPSTFLRIVFAILLCFCLLAGGTVLAFRHATGNPDKTKRWLNQSGFYSTVIQDQLTRLGTSIGSGVTVGSLHLSAGELQKAIQASIPRELAAKDTSNFVDGNYAWLEGKATKPEFSIDLRPAEATFVENSSDYIAKQIDGLPTCSTSQLRAVEQGTSDAASLGCKPPGISGAALADLLPSFLSGADLTQNATLTADSLHFGPTSKPYYQQISKVPHYFQLAKHATVYLIIAIVLLLALIILTAGTVTSALVTIAWASGITGALLIIGGVVTNNVEHGFEKLAFGTLDLGIFKSSVSTLFSRSVSDFGHTEIIAGSVLLVVAALLGAGPKIFAFARTKNGK
jgi:hypothetical protein